MTEIKSVYVGIPSFEVLGDPIEEAIADAIVEKFEVNPNDITVYEKNHQFFVFIKSLNLHYQIAVETISKSKELSQTYDNSVALLTKMVRRVDKYQNLLCQLLKEVQSLEKEEKKLKEELIASENEKKEAQRQIDFSYSPHPPNI